MVCAIPVALCQQIFLIQALLLLRDVLAQSSLLPSAPSILVDCASVRAPIFDCSESVCGSASSWHTFHNYFCNFTLHTLHKKNLAEELEDQQLPLLSQTTIIFCFFESLSVIPNLEDREIKDEK